MVSRCVETSASGGAADELADVRREIIAAGREDELHAVLEDQLFGALKRALRLIHGVEGHQLDEVFPAADLHAAGRVHEVDPDLAPVEPRCGPRLQRTRQRRQKADLQHLGGAEREVAPRDSQRGSYRTSSASNHRVNDTSFLFFMRLTALHRSDIRIAGDVPPSSRLSVAISAPKSGV